MDTEYILTANGELYHWGIKGMKWGIRRYQNKDGSLTPAGKKKYAKEMAKVKAETKRVKNQQKVDAKLKKLDDAKKNLRDLKKGKASKDDNDIQTIEDITTKKIRILESRSAKLLYDNANLFSTNELYAAKLRLELERDISRLEPPTIDKGRQFTDDIINKANTIADVAQSGSKAYNNVAKIYNSMIGKNNGMTLPIIDDKTTSKLDKFKEETDWIKAKNDRKKAEEDGKEKPKSKLDQVKDETAMLKAENEYRKQQHVKEQYDAGNWNNKDDKKKDKKQEDEDDD